MPSILLIGAGHAHLHVASNARQLTDAGIRVVLVDPGTFWYSGMAAGVLAGTYRPEEAQIDPERLITKHGGEFIRASLTGIDPESRTARLSNGETLSYDALSLNIGSTVPVPFPVSGDRLIPVKPLSGIGKIRQRVAACASAAVIGAGATGCEVACCLAEFTRREGFPISITLLGRGKRVLEGLPPAASARMEKALGRAGIEVRTESGVAEVNHRRIDLTGGTSLEADLMLCATGLRPAPRIRDLPPPQGPQGGLHIRSTLQSRGHDRIFAVGDCADLEGHDLPRLGVYGVRQAPVLLHNLRAVLDGTPLKPYIPQKRALQILHTGERRGLLVFGPVTFENRLAFQIKDRIDRRFLKRF